MVQLGNISIDSYLVLSKPLYDSKETIEQVRPFQPIVVPFVALINRRRIEYDSYRGTFLVRSWNFMMRNVMNWSLVLS